MRRKEDVAKIAQQFNSRRAFQVGAPADYQAARRGGYLDEICAHIPPKYKHRPDKELMLIAKKYTERCLLKKDEPQIYDRIVQRGLINEAFSHMPKHVGIGRPGPRYKWSYTTLKELCNQYTDIKKFAKEQAGAYQALSKKGLIEELTSHMKRKVVKRTNKELLTAALQCSSRSEFKKRFPNHYAVSYRKGSEFFKTITTHMEKPKISSGEEELISWVKERYPDAHKTKIYYANGNKRKYYEYDIFIPNLNIAIEYQGLKWHSSEFKKDWRDRDLKKRELAKKRGIRLIVIFEDEWLNNKSPIKIKLLKAFDRDDTSGIFNFIRTIKKAENVTPKTYYFESSNAWQDDCVYEKSGLEFIKDIPPTIYFIKNKKRIRENNTKESLPMISDLGGKIWKIVI